MSNIFNDDLVSVKAVGRPRDLNDIEHLEKDNLD